MRIKDHGFCKDGQSLLSWFLQGWTELIILFTKVSVALNSVFLVKGSLL